MSKKPNKQKKTFDDKVDETLMDLMGGKKMVGTLIVVALIAIVLIGLLYYFVETGNFA